MNRLVKRNEYSFMNDDATVHTVKLTLGKLKYKKQLQLIEPYHWPPNSPGLNPVYFLIWELLEQAEAEE